MIIPLGGQSPERSSSLPAASLSERVVPRRIFGLAPAGVYPAITVTDDAVRSYRTFSPLPDPTRTPADGGCFLWHFPSHRSDRTTAPCPGVTWQPTLWSPDFPRADILADLSRDHPADAHHRRERTAAARTAAPHPNHTHLALAQTTHAEATLSTPVLRCRHDRDVTWPPMLLPSSTHGLQHNGDPDARVVHTRWLTAR